MNIDRCELVEMMKNQRIAPYYHSQGKRTVGKYEAYIEKRGGSWKEIHHGKDAQLREVAEV